MALHHFGHDARVRGVIEKLRDFGSTWAETHSKPDGLHQLKRKSCEFLWALVFSHAPTISLEVGCGSGLSTLWIASAIGRTPGSLLLAVDTDLSKIEIARSYITEAGLVDRVHFFDRRIDTDFLRSESRGGIDFLFIDCHKSDYLPTWELALPFMKPASILVADNIVSKAEELEQFVQRIDILQEKTVLEAATIPCGSGLLVARLLDHEARDNRSRSR